MDALSTTFAALADPTRRAILARLSKGEATVNELAAPFDMQLPSVSKHIKVLMHAGLLSQSRQAQLRVCRLEAAPLKAIANFTLDYQAFWNESFDRLDEYLASPAAAPTPARKKPKKKKRKLPA